MLIVDEALIFMMVQSCTLTSHILFLGPRIVYLEVWRKKEVEGMTYEGDERGGE